MSEYETGKRRRDREAEGNGLVCDFLPSSKQRRTERVREQAFVCADSLDSKASSLTSHCDPDSHCSPKIEGG